MVERPLEHAGKILELVEEIKLHLKDKKSFHETLHLLNKSYQRKQFGYMRYQELRKRLLKDKNVREWDEYYDAYIFGLLKRIDFYNSKIFYDVYVDNTQLKLVIPQKVAKPRPKKREIKLPEPVVGPIEEEPEDVTPLVIKKKVAKSPETVTEASVNEIETTTRPIDEVKPSEVEESQDAEVVGDVPESTAGEPDIAEIRDVPVEMEAEETTEIPSMLEVSEEQTAEERKRVLEKALFSEGVTDKKPKLFASKEKNVLPWLEQEKKEKKPLWNRIKAMFLKDKTVMEQLKEQGSSDDTEVEFRQLFSLKFIKNLVSKKGGDKFISKKTELSPSILALKRYKTQEIEEEAKKESVDTSVLLEEAQRIKSIIQKRRKFTVYEHSTVGALANIMVKKLSLSMIETFPDFFKQIYDNLRLADMKILSNTYVNIMLLSVMVTSIFTYVISAIFFFVKNVPLVLVFLRALVVASLAGGIIFMIFYLYPSIKIKQRRRSINTNMPFAINHMAAVASSGVPPEAMFRLIAESSEYEEISVEIQKITDYIEIFGYDILTAVKSVMGTTPSQRLKEFFGGFLSSIESGGDLKHYLSQKAEEAMLQYKLERQKYLESISTYSDIYTGLLIAAPLFFVVALSLVSLLGGTVGGMEVNSLIAIGTYVIIPLLNVAFIFFLEMTQPEV